MKVEYAISRIPVSAHDAETETASRSQHKDYHARRSTMLPLVAMLLCIAFLALTGSPALSQGGKFEALKDQAFSGSTKAQIELGLTHLRIKGSDRDRILGLAWIIAAAASGDDRAIKLRDKAFTMVNARTGMGAEKVAFDILRFIEESASKRANGLPRTPKIVHLAGTGSAKALAAAINAGADVNAVSSSGMTPLAASLLARRYDLARVLLSAGADANGKSDWGRTLLWEVIERDDAASVALLVANGASVFSPDPAGTPILFSDRVGKRMKSLISVEERDMTRDEVREVQARLKAAGQNPGPIDGLIGRKTWAAFDALAGQKGISAELRNPMAVLLAVRSFVPTSTYDADIRKAIRSAITPVRKTPSRPKKPTKTAAQTFWGDNL